MNMVKVKNPKSGKWMVVIDNCKLIHEDDYDPRRSGVSLNDIPEHKGG